MSAQPECSIIIPSYNYAHYVTRAIDSVLHDPGPSRQVIVVDDGSTDNTAEVLSAYASQIDYVYQTNQGPSAASNHGIRLARGRYVVFLDADDRLLPGGLLKLWETAQRHPEAGIIIGAYQNIDEQGRITYGKPPPKMGSCLDNFRRFIRGDFAIGCGRSLIRRDVLDRIQFPQQLRHGEDWVFHAQILACYPAVSLADRVAESTIHASRLRNQYHSLLKTGNKTIECLFDPQILPREAMALKPIFAARWYGELCRAAWKLRDRRSVRQYSLAAMTHDWTSIWRERHLWRFVRSWLP
ncbi:MAG: hypothetical protein KatS3mg113_0588 [Planctomycetaceae bacterium]|nr:MAG: hypothetical protein KatS3mg113_0588 [Planctomycetaceae bacterium]